MRITAIILCLFTIGCVKRNYEATPTEVELSTKSLLLTEYCLRDLMNGDPTAGGCWLIVDIPAGSTITQAQLDTTDNPCIDFVNEPCPHDYVFQYQACCGDTTCVKPANLTICLTCSNGCNLAPPTITGTCI